VNKIILSLFAFILLVSCGTEKQILYLQDAGHPISLKDSTAALIPDPPLKIGDLLIILVNASTPEAALPFNLPLMPNPTSGGTGSYDPSNATPTGSTGSMQNYLVDTEGDIVFPVLGKIHVAGMTKGELSDYIKNKIHPRYIKEDPIISIRHANYRVSVLGEVNKPGVYPISNERISILEAIAWAGDLTLFGERDNLLLIREGTDGKRETVRIDLRNKNLVNSPYYYLQQNDVLYVQPNKPKTRSAGFGTAETLSISVVGTLISLASLIVIMVKK